MSGLIGKIEQFKKEREKNKMLKKRDAFYINYVAEQTGWSKKAAQEKMDELKPRGVNYRYYVKRRLWSKEGDKLEKSIASIVKVRESEKKGRKHYIRLVCEETGWTPAIAEEKFFCATVFTLTLPCAQ